MTTPKQAASDVVAQYSFVLNAPEFRGRDLMGEEFAKRIAKVFDCTRPWNEYAVAIAEDHIASIRHEVTGRVAWKFKGKEA